MKLFFDEHDESCFFCGAEAAELKFNQVGNSEELTCLHCDEHMERENL